MTPVPPVADTLCPPSAATRAGACEEPRRDAMRHSCPPVFVWRDDASTPAPNTWTYFRKQFEWTHGGTKVVLLADPTARVWLNGRLILDRTQRFVSPHLPREELDLSPALREGSNVIVVLHHWWGVPTFQRAPGGAPGIALGGDCVRTDATWQWRNADEFTRHPHQTIGHDGARRIRFPVLLDLQKEDPRLHLASATTAGWRPVSVVANSAWSRPVPKETPPLELSEARPRLVVNLGTFEPTPAATQPHEIGRRLREASRTPFSGAAELAPGAFPSLPWRTHVARGYACFDFGRPVHGYPRLEIADAPAGAVFEFGYAELATDPRTGACIVGPDGGFDPEFTAGAPFGDRVVLRAGAQSAEIPDERTWSWLLVQWECPDGGEIVVSDLLCRTSQHPVVVRGSFSSGDARLDALIRLCLDHARITMSDTYVDTPGREDAQWLEDIQYRARLAATWFGDTSLRRVAIRHAAEQQDPCTGLFRVFAPESHGETGCQFLDWGMTWIGLLHDDWLWNGDTAFVRRHFPALETFLSALHRRTGADGLLTGENTLGDLRTSLHADYAAGGVDSIPNAWYHGYLLQAAELAAAIGEDACAREWTHRADRIRGNFARFLARLPDGSPTVAEIWSPAEGPAGFGQAAVVSAVFHGLVTGEDARALLAAAFTAPDGSPPVAMKRWNTPTYVYRALRCLCEHGLGEIARAHLFSIYAPHLPDGPLPEYFLPGEAQPADPTGSHGWAAVPLAWLHDTVLGMRHRSATAGPRVAIEPRRAGWDTVSGTLVTPEGPVAILMDWPSRSLHVSDPNGVATRRSLPSLPAELTPTVSS